MQLLTILGLSSFALALIITPLFARIFLRLGLVDLPDQNRKFHDRPIPRLGGIPLVISYVVALLLFVLVLSQSKDHLHAPGDVFWRIAPGAGIVFLIGLLDDLVDLKPWQKLSGQVAAAIVGCANGVHIGSIHGIATDAWWTWPLTIAWLAVCTNAFNLIDGLDGLAAGVGLVATSTALVAALINHQYELAVATIPLVGALFGFLYYNFNPASIFLGDSGSLTIGFLLGCYGVLWSQKSATLFGMAAPLMALSVPLLDVFVSVIRRFLRHQPIFSPDRGHIHHRLLANGFTPRTVALILYGVCALAAVLSLLQSLLFRHVGGVIVVLFCVIAVFGIRCLKYTEFSAIQQLVLGGDIRRIMEYQIDLQDLRKTLESTKDIQEEWSAIAKTCQKLGFDFVSMHVNGRDFSMGLQNADSSKSWCFEVSLRDGVLLRLRGSLKVDQTVPLMPLITVFQERFSAVFSATADNATPARLFPTHNFDLTYAGQPVTTVRDAV